MIDFMQNYFSMMVPILLAFLLLGLGLYLIFRASRHSRALHHSRISHARVNAKATQGAADSQVNSPVNSQMNTQIDTKENAKTHATATQEEKNISIAELIQTINQVAGEDKITTQLDLARAYMEVGKIQLAKNILQQIIQQGSESQQQEATYLLNFL